LLITPNARNMYSAYFLAMTAAAAAAAIPTGKSIWLTCVLAGDLTDDCYQQKTDESHDIVSRSRHRFHPITAPLIDQVLTDLLRHGETTKPDDKLSCCSRESIVSTTDQKSSGADRSISDEPVDLLIKSVESSEQLWSERDSGGRDTECRGRCVCVALRRTSHGLILASRHHRYRDERYTWCVNTVFDSLPNKSRNYLENDNRATT